MLRTILFFLVFLVLLLSELFPVLYFEQAIILRFSPFIMLIVILLFSWFGRPYTVRLKNVAPAQIKLIRIFNALSALFIIAGALLRLLNYPFAQWGIILGLGCMSVWSFLIFRYTKAAREEDPNIIDSEADGEDDDL